MECFNCDYYREYSLSNCCELTQEECFLPRTEEHSCYYINDDYTFKNDIPFFGFEKGIDSKTRRYLYG